LTNLELNIEEIHHYSRVIHHLLMNDAQSSKKYQVFAHPRPKDDFKLVGKIQYC